ncbi:SixA phosphatase family protein [Geoalkalibacter halelectricus]|uniref:Histidine phosphatase family protein n=1 Tax=Geoalkalibacter halelectricus TaxID=2847045 RepID=A0ABY5ZM33_9BACT|nr:histidine phosphatase family protein [Geoalkalibacter halelectricus]MDO3378492.1 histidine phosphatase family protein [Geoalkalibacter halelectricus]UWZ80190.1 histidine phosphatase family protein [Geoalkalibacter halelectricus]
MLLFLVRHAKAVERSFDIAEENRYLTPEGRERFRAAAATLRKKGMAAEVIVSSPLVRAVQTAEILAEALAFKGLLTIDELLVPGFSLEELRKLLGRHPGVKSLACVGHEPDLGELGGTLLGMPEAFPLSKGAVLALDWEPQKEVEKARFLWLLAKGKFHTDVAALMPH